MTLVMIAILLFGVVCIRMNSTFPRYGYVYFSQMSFHLTSFTLVVWINSYNTCRCDTKPLTFFVWTVTLLKNMHIFNENIGVPIPMNFYSNFKLTIIHHKCRSWHMPLPEPMMSRTTSNIRVTRHQSLNIQNKDWIKMTTRWNNCLRLLHFAVGFFFFIKMHFASSYFIH